jgi:aminoglycoside/choline kinase family phosphotransferase
MEQPAVNDRELLLLEWLDGVLPTPPARIAPASSDASFRRYFRVWYDGQTRIVMDAPPDKEDCRPFVAIGQAMRGLGLNVPEVLAGDLDRGLLLLTDLGNRQYLAELGERSVSRLYGDALDALARLQVGGDPSSPLLPPYDSALLHREMDCSAIGFWGASSGWSSSQDELRALDHAFALLADNALEQPRVWVHRDYHSRNLMVTDPDNPGVLDFQDAVVGAVTYDLVSLLRDCYIAWPRERVESWALAHRARLRALGMSGLDDAGAVPALVRPDGRAAPSQGHRHFRPLESARRQARLLCAIFPALWATCWRWQSRYPDLAACAICCWRVRWTAGSQRREGDDPRRRARRTDAPAHRSHPQTPATRSPASR